jgi:outer membrane biosynthesis protein TonB
MWPEDLVHKYSGRMVTAFAIITDEGKVEQPTIKDSPDPLLDEFVRAALRNWTFRPARRDGEAVSAKMLLGIPVLVLD